MLCSVAVITVDLRGGRFPNVPNAGDSHVKNVCPERRPFTRQPEQADCSSINQSCPSRSHAARCATGSVTAEMVRVGWRPRRFPRCQTANPMRHSPAAATGRRRPSLMSRIFRSAPCARQVFSGVSSSLSVGSASRQATNRPNGTPLKYRMLMPCGSLIQGLMSSANVKRP